MARTAVLGFPRIGADRELKFALEDHWAGRKTEAELQNVARAVRTANLLRGLRTRIDVLPVGDFALYDHVLDTAEMAGVVAERHRPVDGRRLAAHFLACRGGQGVTALRMTKWFDTNYHYLVPELTPDQGSALRADKWVAHLREARELGLEVRPVVLGPVSLLLLAKGAADPLRLLPRLTEVYAQLFVTLAAEGAQEVQVDEPCLVLDRSAAELDAFARAYESLAGAAPVELCMATYFGGLDDGALTRISRLPIAELHVDLVRAPQRLDAVLDALPADARLSAGVVDGRNVWATDLDLALDRLDHVVARIGSERLTVAPSCSLLHVPHSAAREQAISEEIRPWLAFGAEKLAELTLLAAAVDADPVGRKELLADSRLVAAARRGSRLTNDPDVRRRVASLRESRLRPARARRGAPGTAARASRPAGASDDHDRLVPADPGDPPGAPALALRAP